MTDETEDLYKKRDDLTAGVLAQEVANRSPEMQAILLAAANQYGAEAAKDKIRIVEDFPGATCPIAVFQHPDTGVITAAPLDQFVMSEYDYRPTAEQEVQRKEQNKGLRDGITMSGPLKLVENGELKDPKTEITVDQLTAIQNLLGNNSTWWPVKDYSYKEFRDVFNAIELSIVYKDGVPAGVAHLDKQGLYVDGDVEAKVLKDDPAERSTKIMFIGLDPALNGKGIGREVLHEMMNRGFEGGAAYLGLDTVLHRDRRSDSKTEQLSEKSAGSIYEAAGFKLCGVSAIDTSDKIGMQEAGVAINQLNGPKEYVSENFEKLRSAVYTSFGLDVNKSLETIGKPKEINLLDRIPEPIKKGVLAVVGAVTLFVGGRASVDTTPATIAANDAGKPKIEAVQSAIAPKPIEISKDALIINGLGKTQYALDNGSITKISTDGKQTSTTAQSVEDFLKDARTNSRVDPEVAAKMVETLVNSGKLTQEQLQAVAKFAGAEASQQKAGNAR